MSEITTRDEEGARAEAIALLDKFNALTMEDAIRAAVGAEMRARAAESRAASAEAEVEKLRKAIKDFLDGNYQHPRAYRPGKCPHDIWYFDECGSCNDEHFTNALKESIHV